MAKVSVVHIAEAFNGGVARQLQLASAVLPRHDCDLGFIVSLNRNLEHAKITQGMREIGFLVETVSMVREPSPLRDFQAFLAIKKILKKMRPDLVHTHSSKGGMLGRLAARVLGIPAIHTPHVYAFEWTGGIRRSVFRSMERLAAGWCSKIITLTEWQKQTAIENGIPADKLVTIPNGVNPEDFAPPNEEERACARRFFNLEDETAIGMAGRFEPQKGIDVFLQAARSVVEKHPRTVFLLAGEGSLKETYVRQTESMGLARNIRFVGRMENIKGFYHALDALALSSLWEGLPYVLLEAQAAGLPVVASRTAGAGEIVIDNETGILVPTGDPQALAGGIIKIISDPENARRMGAAGTVRINEKFGIDIWAERLAELYRETLTENR